MNFGFSSGVEVKINRFEMGDRCWARGRGKSDNLKAREPEDNIATFENQLALRELADLSRAMIGEALATESLAKPCAIDVFRDRFGIELAADFLDARRDDSQV